MRGLKQFFRMIVAAVVCFTVSVFSGSKKEKIMELLDQGKNKEANANQAESNVVYPFKSSEAAYCAESVLKEQIPQLLDIELKRDYGSMKLKKMNYRFLGPGDSSARLYEASG